MSKLIERLCKKIKDEVGCDCDPASFRRTYAGYWQRSNGAWSWFMLTKGGWDIGSSEPATKCVQKKYKIYKIGTELYLEERKETK